MDSAEFAGPSLALCGRRVSMAKPPSSARTAVTSQAGYRSSRKAGTDGTATPPTSVGRLEAADASASTST